VTVTGWKRAALVVATTPVAGLALAALAPSGWWIAGLALHWAPQLALGSLPLWCWLGRRPAIGLALLLIAGTALWPSLRAAHASQAPAPGPGAISVTTANLYFHSLQHPEALARLDGELLVLIETRPEDRALLAHDPRWPHQRWQQSKGSGGLALLSRFPMQAKDFELVEAYGIDARVELPWGTTRLLCLHTWSPRNARSSARNRRQLAELAGLTESGPGPLLVLGDLNASLADPGLGLLRRAGLDVPQGGEVRTWPSWLGPFGIAIDHVLARDLALGGANAIDLPGSDHHAVQVRVSGGATALLRQNGRHAPTATSAP
jgi:endonuclease/exonuclease/phosphatase (EEP) superfamily protein YafD